MWMSLFFIAFIFSVFAIYLIQVQTRKIGELETANWILRRKLSQWHDLWQQVKEDYEVEKNQEDERDQAGQMVNAIFEQNAVKRDWYDEAWEDARRILEKSEDDEDD